MGSNPIRGLESKLSKAASSQANTQHEAGQELQGSRLKRSFGYFFFVGVASNR